MAMHCCAGDVTSSIPSEISGPLPFIFVVGFLLLKFHKLEAFYYFESKEIAVGFGERWFPNLNLPFHTLNLK